jgi:hypothetical protein
MASFVRDNFLVLFTLLVVVSVQLIMLSFEHRPEIAFLAILVLVSHVLFVGYCGLCDVEEMKEMRR